MAQITTEIKHINENEVQIVHVNGDGKVKDAISYKLIEAPDSKTIGRTLLEMDKKDSTYRNTFQALLGAIMVHPRLDGFRGKGDTSTGKTSPELKAAIRDAETAVIEDMIKRGDIRLAKGDDIQVEMQRFLKTLRDNKNYSNIKSYCTGYFAFVGKNPVTGSGRLVPQPQMVEETKMAIHRTPTDKSFYSQFTGIQSSLEKATIDVEDARKCMDILSIMLQTVKGIVSDADAQVTANHQNVGKATANALRDAAKGPGQGAHKAPAKHGEHAPALV